MQHLGLTTFEGFIVAVCVVWVASRGCSAALGMNLGLVPIYCPNLLLICVPMDVACCSGFELVEYWLPLKCWAETGILRLFLFCCAVLLTLFFVFVTILESLPGLYDRVLFSLDLTLKPVFVGAV